jgi:hypothetical protein
MRQEMMLGDYWRWKYPSGRPSLQTLRRDMIAGRLPGKIEQVGKNSRYTVYINSTSGDDEVDDILRELS